MRLLVKVRENVHQSVSSLK